MTQTMGAWKAGNACHFGWYLMQSREMGLLLWKHLHAYNDENGRREFGSCSGNLWKSQIQRHGGLTPRDDYCYLKIRLIKGSWQCQISRHYGRDFKSAVQLPPTPDFFDLFSAPFIAKCFKMMSYVVENSFVKECRSVLPSHQLFPLPVIEDHEVSPCGIHPGSCMHKGKARSAQDPVIKKGFKSSRVFWKRRVVIELLLNLPQSLHKNKELIHNKIKDKLDGIPTNPQT